MISLALVLMLMGGIVGCTSKNNSSGSSSDDTIIIPTPEEEVIEYTNYKLVDSGTSAYKIVIEDNAAKKELFAAEEIQELFYEATSINLNIVKESEVAYSKNANLILLGDTQYTKNTGIDVSDIPSDGFTLQNDGSNLFILGENYGVLYGAYEFLNKSVGYEYFFADAYSLYKNVTNLYMPKLAYSDAPDFAYRLMTAPAFRLEKDKDRARVRAENSYYFQKSFSWCHSTFSVLPPETYQGEYPSWYSNDGGQLCYTAHGNAGDLLAMQATVLERFQQEIRYNFDQGDYREFISFTQQDKKDSWCDCSACQEVFASKGAYSAAIILFLNPVARELKAWLNETYPGHEVSIVFFAYQQTQDAPIKEVNGKKVPVDESVILEDNLVVYLAPITGQYLYSIYDQRNAKMYEYYLDWSVLTPSKQIHSWNYCTNYRDYFMWYDATNTLQDLFQYLRDRNVSCVFNLSNCGYRYGSDGRYGFTGFTALKDSLNTKLMWDADLDVKRFTDRFFDTYFGVASEPMRSYYESFRRWSEYLRTELKMYGGVYWDKFTQKDYPKQVLLGWYEEIERAYAFIETLQATDPEEYQILHDRITQESMAIRYALITLHKDSYSASELASMKAAFEVDAYRLNFGMQNEITTLVQFFEVWGTIPM